MCSLAFVNHNIDIDIINKANYFQKFRGPDETVIENFYGNILVHNLLSITGKYCKQPIINSTGNIALLFNGEIYNYKNFGDFNCDSECILKLYESDNDGFYKNLDGEFSFVICDISKNKIIICCDVFGTKPLHYSVNSDGKFGVSSYPSFLKNIGFTDILQVKPNNILYYSLDGFKLLMKHEVKTFKLDQYKNSYEDWIISFESSIKKRVPLDKKMFTCLSSGYDSGVIFHELNRQNAKFNTYCIKSNEDEDILRERFSFFKEYDGLNIISVNKYDVEDFKNTVENFDYGFYNQSVLSDNGALGMHKICKTAKESNCKVLLSGQGSDEIFSDYGILGYDRYKYSTLKGIFPEDLISVFPWNNFYNGKQRAYLLKEESVCGSHGIEARYPFLDVNVVQEFLSLDVKLKNRRYKSPIDYYFNKYKFPYLMNDKKGFSP